MSLIERDLDRAAPAIAWNLGFWGLNRRTTRFICSTCKARVRLVARRYMAGILPIRRKTQNNQSFDRMYLDERHKDAKQ